MKRKYGRFVAILLLAAFSVLQSRAALAACIQSMTEPMAGCCEETVRLDNAPSEADASDPVCGQQCVQGYSGFALDQKPTLVGDVSPPISSRSTALTYPAASIDPTGSPVRVAVPRFKTPLIYLLQRLLI